MDKLTISKVFPHKIEIIFFPKKRVVIIKVF